MQRKIAKSYARLKLLCILIFSTANAQDLEQTIAFAKEQQQSGNFETAIKAYERAMFFGDQEARTSCAYPLAEACFFNGQFEKAIQYYDYAYNLTRIDSIQYFCKFRKATIYLFQSRPHEALSTLLALPSTKSLQLEQRRKLYLATAYFSVNEFHKAESLLLQLAPDYESELKIYEAFRKTDKLNNMSHERAKKLSLLLPGLGQLSAGDLKNSLNSLLLTGTLVVVGVSIGINYGIFDAVISILPWFVRYYKGGAKKAGRLVEEKFQKRKAEVYDEIISILQSER